jgi:hypothetical protein
LVVQSAKNGEPVAWGKAPFGGLTPFPDRRPLLGSSSQGMFMLLVRQVIGTAYEVSGGLRFNRWSGAYAVQTDPGPLGRWNNMFNVDWGGFDANGVPNPGYAARSTDFMLGLRYRINDKLWPAPAWCTWARPAPTTPASVARATRRCLHGWVRLQPSTSRPERLGTVSAYQFGRKGQAPLSMPAHNAFTNIDSRVANRGNSVVGVGANKF